MKRTLATSILTLSMMGCTSSTNGIDVRNPTTQISGVVTMTDGTPVWMAQVSTPRGTVYTNQVGVFRLTLPVSRDETTIEARDGFTPGRIYAVTHSGSVTVRPDRDRVVGIVLRYASPI